MPWSAGFNVLFVSQAPGAAGHVGVRAFVCGLTARGEKLRPVGLSTILAASSNKLNTLPVPSVLWSAKRMILGHNPHRLAVCAGIGPVLGIMFAAVFGEALWVRAWTGERLGAAARARSSDHQDAVDHDGRAFCSVLVVQVCYGRAGNTVNPI
jgi:hypothetical protein